MAVPCFADDGAANDDSASHVLTDNSNGDIDEPGVDADTKTPASESEKPEEEETLSPSADNPVKISDNDVSETKTESALDTQTSETNAVTPVAPGYCSNDAASDDVASNESLTVDTQSEVAPDNTNTAPTATDVAMQPSQTPGAAASSKPARAPAKATLTTAKQNASTPKASTTKKSASATKTVIAKKTQKTSAKKVARKAKTEQPFFKHNAVYYISSALAKGGKYVLSVKDSMGNPKTNVVLSSSAKNLAQYWRVKDRGNGIYRFVNYAGGYYLAVSGNVKQRANVYVAKSGIIDWKVVKNSDGTYSLKPVDGNKAFLSIANAEAKKGANVQLWPSISNNGQKFTFKKNKRLTRAYANGKTATPGIVKISVADSKLRVGIAGSSKKKNAKAKTVAASKKSSQVFQLRYTGNGLYEFQNANSFKVLSVYKSSKKAGAAVVQTARKKNLSQMWYLKKTGKGYQIISARSGLAVDIDGSEAAKGKVMKMAKPSKNASQRFTFGEAKLVTDGTYVVQSAMAMPLVLSVAGNSKKEGANVQLSRSAGSQGEKFKIEYLGEGVYRIKNATTNKSIDIAGSSNGNGANIQMAASKDKSSQKWVIELGDDGIMFKSVQSGKYLNVNGGQAKTGANVNQRTASGKLNQCWTLASSDWSYYAGVGKSAMKLIKKAEEYEGWRYQWGGRSPSTSFDCAGLVMYCSNKAWGTSFDLMNTNAEMLYNRCTHISASQAKSGDLVFYRGTYGSDVNYISHVVIFTGDGYMYGAGDPIGYTRVNAIRNFKGKKATAVYARIRH